MEDISNIFIYKLMKAGYGNYTDLINLPVNIIIDMNNYLTFTNKYEELYYNLLDKENK